MDATAIAARIEERAVQLEREQLELQVAEQQLHDVQAQLDAEQQRSRRIRREYLERMMQSHSLELECHKMEGLIENRKARTMQLKEEEAKIMEQVNSHETEWMTVYETELVQHEHRKDIYKKYVQGAIDAQTEAESRRNSMVDAGTRLTAQLKTEIESIVQMQQQLQGDIDRMTTEENEANKTVEVLAEQVRAALAKRSSLRLTYREAQVSRKRASEEAEALAHEYRNCH